MDTAIEINDLCKIYKTNKKSPVHALMDLNLSIAPGEVVGFLGPNGAGKSTTIKILTAQTRATSGSIYIQGSPSVLPNSRAQIGYLPENPSFYGFMTAKEYLYFVGGIFSMSCSHICESTNRVLKLLNLEEAADRLIKTYSKGMVQRLGLAQTLIHDPVVYIFDEPMSGLDPLGRALVKELIKKLKGENKTVFFSTHVTSDVEAVCDRVAVLVEGRLVAVERVADLLRQGTEGYVIEAFKEEGFLEEFLVSKDQLSTKLDDLKIEKYKIESVNPKIKDLEKFFLELVARSENENKKQI